MPFFVLTGSLANFTNTSATLNFNFTSVFRSNAEFSLVATPVGGGAPITLGTSNFGATGFNLNSPGQLTFNFTSTLPNGDYNFTASAAQTPGIFAPANFPSVATASNIPIVCFLAGTRIATPSGEVAVETLKAGDLVLTADGNAVPVLWLGRQSVSGLFGMAEASRPVRIAAGALGEGLPKRDLRLTAGHALLLDGTLINAGALVNGTTISRLGRAELGDRFTVYHIETERHEIVLAEGVPSETFIDNVSRRRFDNHAEFEALFGTPDRPMTEMDQPRALSARQVPAAIRARVAAQAAGESRAAA